MKRIIFIGVCIAIVSSLVLLWLWKYTPSTGIPSSLVTPVTVRLKWLHQAQFAGHYVADKKGWYKEVGIQPTLVSFDYTDMPIEEVVEGRAQFGVTGADELLVAREQGKPVIALAVIYQDNPVVAYTLASSGITKPTDFIGKKLGMEAGVNVETVIHAMLTAQGIDWKKSVKEIPIGFDANPLLQHEVDIATGYVTNEPILAQEAGQRVTIIAPHEYGIKLYADVLFTTSELIETKPDLVRAFVKATLRGWEYAVAHVDEAVSYTLQYPDADNNALNTAHQKALLTNSIPYIKPTSGYKIGSMSYVEWKRTFDILRENGVLTKGQDVAKAYTMEFLRSL